MLYINVEVNGTQMQALIDCGAEFTLMTSNCVEKCGLSNIIDPEFEMTAVGIGTAKISGRIAFRELFGCEKIFSSLAIFSSLI